MSKFVLVLVCLTFIQASLALKCKRCKDPKDITCAVLEDETCPGASGDKEAVCLTFTFKDSTGKEVTEKKCSIGQKGQKYQCQLAPGAQEIKCDTCMSDMCNEKSGAHQVAFGALTIATAVFALVAHRIF